MKLVEGFDSNYRYVLVAARRARQLQNGAQPVVPTHSRKPCRIAEEEIQAGMVKWTILIAAYTTGCIWLSMRRMEASGTGPKTPRGRLREMGWGLALLALTVSPARRITAIEVIADPDRLRQLRLALLPE